MANVLRYTLAERLVHLLASATYVYLLGTGLAFWTPALYWMAVVLGGGYLSRQLHPWAGLIFTMAVVWLWVVWHSDLRIRDHDRRWRRAIGSYVRNEDGDVPGAGRFNYGQKVFFWVMAFGGIALLASGCVMWFVAAVPADLLAVRAVATLVHAVAALLTVGGFIVHVYMGVAVVPGGLHAVVHGDVSEEWARYHHPLWLWDLRGAAAPRHTAGRSDPGA